MRVVHHPFLAVRGVDLICDQSVGLVVSGGDDYKLKFWNYKTGQCLFTLLGHLDWIRTVQFHPDPNLPLVLSASDDQTLQIWDYRRRTCLSILTGHNHHVACAIFHPTANLIASTSTDQTVRLWDSTGLVSQFGEASQQEATSSGKIKYRFSTNNVVRKCALSGHKGRFNWACFHPALPFLASAGDDRLQLWRIDESQSNASQVDTFLGDACDTSCCVFHTTSSCETHVLVSTGNKEPSIQAWDLSRGIPVSTWPLPDGHRVSVLASASRSGAQNLLAAGHETGLFLFQLDGDEVPFVTPTTPTIEQDTEHQRQREKREAGLRRIRSQRKEKSQGEMPSCSYFGRYFVARLCGTKPPFLSFFGLPELLCSAVLSVGSHYRLALWKETMKRILFSTLIEERKVPTEWKWSSHYWCIGSEVFACKLTSSAIFARHVRWSPSSLHG